MLHEVLFALAGHTGDVIVRGKNGVFAVSDDVDFLEDSERAVLNSIVTLGGRYAELCAFVQQYRHQSLRERTGGAGHGTDNTGEQTGKERVVEGLYVAALCQGIDSLLQQYRRDLVAVEQSILRQPSFPLASLSERLSSHMTLLATLQDIKNTVSTKGLKGGALISYLSQKSLSGVPVIRAVARGKGTHTHTNLRPVASAMERLSLPRAVPLPACLYPVVIIPSYTLSSSRPVSHHHHHTHTTTSRSLLKSCYRVFYQQLAEWCVHGLLRDPYHEFMVSRIGAPPTPFEVGSGSQAVDIMAAQNAWLSEFSVNLHMLPQAIPLRVAEKILFIGKAQMILTDNFRLNQFMDRQQEQRGSVASAMGMELPRRQHPVARMDASELNGEIARLRAMRSFQPGTFEGAIDRIRGIVSKALWTMFVISADLGEQLRALKDYFLLGRGDFYQVFLEESRAMMSSPPESNAQHELTFLFQQACSKSTSDSDPLFKLFKIQMPDVSKGSDSDCSSPWREMRLQYKVQWPLHLLFHETVMEEYNTLFSFLIHVKRVQTEVHGMWLLQQRCKGLPTPERARQAKVWRQRENMAFVIDNLQHYLCDVLEVQYTQLMERIQVSTDFESLRKAHEEYVSVLLRDCCFVHTPVISRALEEIFRLSARFCSLWRRVDARDPGADLFGTEMEEISTAFRRQSSLLFTYLSHQTSRYLGQLLLRLDYNRHFTRSCLSGSDSGGLSKTTS